MTTETEELPPLWARNEAMRRSTPYIDWDDYSSKRSTSSMVDRIVLELARTIAKHEPAPLPHQRERGELARLLRFMNMKSAAYQVESGGGQDGLLGEYLAILKERGL